MPDQDITLKLSLVNALLGYLGTRPYSEVFQIVQEIQSQALPQVKTSVQESAGLTE